MASYEDSVIDLIKGTIGDARDLIRSEIALARAEMRQEVSRLTSGAVAFAGAAVIGLLALAAACAAAALGLAAALEWPAWAGYAVVAVALLLIAGILAAVGRSRMTAHSPMPLTTETLKENVEWMQNRKP
jgi:uncharacterized membrane protein YhiD involved in acid resistance